MSESDITPELLMIMAAAISTYLGKNVRIRKARFICNVGPSSWSQVGRVSIQTSHTLQHH
jgi:methylmalonyl-CoA carboxyltransferase 12S subunit